MLVLVGFENKILGTSLIATCLLLAELVGLLSGPSPSAESRPDCAQVLTAVPGTSALRPSLRTVSGDVPVCQVETACRSPETDSSEGEAGTEKTPRPPTSGEEPQTTDLKRSPQTPDLKRSPQTPDLKRTPQTPTSGEDPQTPNLRRRPPDPQPQEKTPRPPTSGEDPQAPNLRKRPQTPQPQEKTFRLLDFKTRPPDLNLRRRPPDAQPQEKNPIGRPQEKPPQTPDLSFSCSLCF
ncbi:hypothetical protein P7K49_032485 [Saguinus oedipus]|uniref:Uncharacterized protein n=1 Tax=Saguinus oedipus TaxID=9490 RepID=A0ABQ9TYD6_SAGOE|nr:hypothetical protein P7K49_032485 [Saguinus oedipus]